MATNKKGKTSKSAKSKKVVISYEKRIKEKKKEILVEMTEDVIHRLEELSDNKTPGYFDEYGVLNRYSSDIYPNPKLIKGTLKRFGKNYIVLDNTEEISSI